MPITVGGTTITFNDGTTQTTAAGGAPTTAQVLSATAGASVGAVGSYAYLVGSGNTIYSPGDTIAGSGCRYAAANASWFRGSFSGVQGGTPSGTWRILGYPSDYGVDYSQNATVMLRIS